MPTLAVNNFNIGLSVLGGWVSLFGLVSFLCKEHFYLSEACECILERHSSCKALRFAFVTASRRIERNLGLTQLHIQ